MSYSKLCLVLLGVLLMASEIEGATTQCQRNECNFNDPFIFVDNGGVISFNEAQAACQAMGTTLATMTTTDEVIAARESCADGSGSSVGNCWMGLSYDGTDDPGTFDIGRYMWVDGTTPSSEVLTEGFGNSGEPGEYAFFEDCIEIRGDGRSYDIEIYLCMVQAVLDVYVIVDAV